MTLPYYKQQTPFTCALACLRMVLEYIDIKTAEYQLAEIINFKPKKGVSPKMMEYICGYREVKYTSHFGSTTEELFDYVRKGFYPITLVKPSTLYDLPESEHGHYIIVKVITDKSVIINDPDQLYGGEDKEIELGKFIKAWDDKFRLIFVLEGRV